MQEKSKTWVEARNVRLADKVLKKDKRGQRSSVQKENSNEIKSIIIKYISTNSTLQCNLIEGSFIYKDTDQDIQYKPLKFDCQNLPFRRSLASSKLNPFLFPQELKFSPRTTSKTMQ